MDTQKRTNWWVRVYNEAHEIDCWIIENRTEHEADKEAFAEIQGRSGVDDWTLSEIRADRP